MKSISLVALTPLALLAFVAMETPFDKHVATMQKAATFSVKYKVSEIGGNSDDRSLVLGRNNQIRFETSTSLVVSSGTEVITYDKSKKTFTRSTYSPEWLKKMLGDDSTWAWSAFLDANLGKQISASKAGAMRNTRGVKTTDFALTRTNNMAPITVIVDAASGLVRGATYKNAAGKDIVVQSSEISVSDKPADASIFAWVAPADAKEAVAGAPGAVTYADVKPILDQSCAGCHGGARPKDGIDLSSYAAIMGSRTVKAGDSAGSFMIRVIKSGKMPPQRPMAAGELDQLTKWIDGGALEK